MFSAFQTFGRLGLTGGRSAPSLAAQIMAMSPKLWLEPSTANYQDSAGTTLVTQPGGGAADPPVGKVLDLSGLGNHATQSTSTARPKLSARVNLLTGTATLSTQSVTVAAGAHTMFWTGAGTVTASGACVGALTSGATFTTTAGTLTLTVSGSVTSAQLNTGTTAQRYQAVTDASNYDYSGFPLYWKFDGTDDWLATGNIDLTGTDKVTVVAGVMKPDDSTQIVAELSANVNTNAGSFYFVCGNDVNKNGWNAKSRGDAASNENQIASAIYSGFDLAVLTMTHDIAGDLSRIRRNGVYKTDATGDMGAGNFGNYPLYIGARGGTSVFFNSNIYALLVFPRILTAAEIATAERYAAQLSGVTL